MLAKLIAFSLRQSSLVIAAAALLVVFAGTQVKEMPVDVFPELNAPTVVVMTEAGGLAADEVELNVTFPIETAVNGLPGTRRVRSASATSLSIVWVEFDWGTDIYRARQMVSERLAAVRENLPPDTHAEITPVTSITGEIMLMALSSPDGAVSPLELRSFAEFDLRNKILAVPGVAQVVAIGGELPQYQVNVEHGLRSERREPRTPDPSNGACHERQGHRADARQVSRWRRCHNWTSCRGPARSRAEARHRHGPWFARSCDQRPEEPRHQHARVDQAD
jgi:Cu/Ag efflux pump CusA